MTDRDMALEGTQRRFVEDLRDQSHVLEDQDLGPVAHCDARGFLSAVLQGIQSEIGELGDLFARSPDTEDAASVLGAFLSGEQVVVESSITTGHGTECRRGRPLVRIGDRGANARWSTGNGPARHPGRVIRGTSVGDPA
ncbi:hypothetical protein GCM10010284_14330 [Streptomyces rubiginosohelvolus]|uniref:Uncharacterized protein n=1 Tax=Streptomyces rubiginosohelvolus TaxID=67362 RepID=A0ABQ3CAL3_9ACTN|nr:hypothetical protein GCM10010284_14330 [Streptomyces rubiginosohelvolus]GGZ80829.1 hypothetical protein GCM10010328_64270 [Streptomyces pluricolorescens]